LKVSRWFGKGPASKKNSPSSIILFIADPANPVLHRFVIKFLNKITSHKNNKLNRWAYQKIDLHCIETPEIRSHNFLGKKIQEACPPLFCTITNSQYHFCIRTICFKKLLPVKWPRCILSAVISRFSNFFKDGFNRHLAINEVQPNLWKFRHALHVITWIIS